MAKKLYGSDYMDECSTSLYLKYFSRRTKATEPTRRNKSSRTTLFPERKKNQNKYRENLCGILIHNSKHSAHFQFLCTINAPRFLKMYFSSVFSSSAEYVSVSLMRFIAMKIRMVTLMLLCDQKVEIKRKM